MEESFFKIRKPRTFRKNKYDLGPFFGFNPLHITGYFVMRIFKLAPNDYLPFYEYHFAYYLNNNPNASEETFLNKVLDIIDKDIKAHETLHYYDTLSKSRIKKLSQFRVCLKMWISGI